MSDLHEHSNEASSMSTLILISVIILALFYLLAKGCTNRPVDKAAPASHGTTLNRVASEPFLPAA